MPTYDYRCMACGRDFELFQRMSDPAEAECPGCGREAERLISGGAGFLFRGDGFYITDYRSEEYRKRERAEGEAGGSKEGGKERADSTGSDPAATSGKEPGSEQGAPAKGAGKGAGKSPKPKGTGDAGDG
ncbi:MAG: zinc ribbon domain-containing protein [Gemmatimonadetes bacterium]|nr:zinc ribbon domain-containing protein [Gemmatimonadota bacterium]